MRAGTSSRRLWLLLLVSGLSLHSVLGAENKHTVAASVSDLPSDLQAPIVGFVAQQARLVHRVARSSAAQARQFVQVRPVVGIPGAAALGGAISLPSDLTSIAISPTQAYLIGERGTNESPALLSLGPTGAGPELTISGAFPNSDRVEFSPTGSTAALYSASLQSVQVITGLPNLPQVSQQFDVSSLPASLTALAVTDDGATLLAGVSDFRSSTGGVYLISAANGARRVASAVFPAAIRFAQSDSAVVADSGTNQVLLFSGITGTFTSTVLAGSADGVKSPTQIEIIAGGYAVLVANTSSDALLWIDIPTAKTTPVPFLYRVEALHAVTGNPVVFVSSSPFALWPARSDWRRAHYFFVPGSN